MSDTKVAQYKEEKVVDPDAVEQAEHTKEENWNQVHNTEEQATINCAINYKPERNKTMQIKITSEDDWQTKEGNQTSVSPPLLPTSHVRSSLRQLFAEKPFDETYDRDTLGVDTFSRDRHLSASVSFALHNVKNSLEVPQPEGREEGTNRVSDVYQPKKGSFAVSNENKSNEKKSEIQASTRSQKTSRIKMVPPNGIPKVPIEVQFKQTAGHLDILNNMLSAWYWTGYYTGLEKRMSEENKL